MDHICPVCNRFKFKRFAFEGNTEVCEMKLNSEFMSLVRPLNLGRSLRIGSDFDGGYVVPEIALQKIEYLYSYGYGYNFEFENHLIDLKNIQVFLYDDKASIRSLLLRFMTSLLVRPFIKSVKHAPRKILYDFSNYLKMIKNEKIHYYNRKVIGIGSGSNRKSKTIIFDKSIKTSNIYFLNTGIKIDIEGYEYIILNKSEIDFKDYAFIIIEFHDIDNNLDLFKKIVSNLSVNFVIANTHINNYGQVSSKGIPSIVEIVFVNKSLSHHNSYVQSIPSNLDKPCCMRLPDIYYAYDGDNSDGKVIV
jgi:hypothetical protein